MNRPLSAIDDLKWERLRYRGAPIKESVLADSLDPTTPLLHDQVWQSFKERCAADGNVIPQLIAHLEPQDDPGMFRRRGPRKRKGSEPFSDLLPLQRLEAEATFKRLCDKWDGNLPPWRRAILIGVARRLTLHPPTPEWGKRMRRIKGGVHCQRKYRQQGEHPLMKLNQAMAKRRMVILDAKIVTLNGEKGDNQGSERPPTPLQEARRRLGVTSQQFRGVGRVARIVETIPDGLESIVEGLRWSREPDAHAFLQKYDSIPAADLEHLTIDEISAAAGVGPRRLLTLAVDGMLEFSLLTTKIQIASNLPEVTRVMAKNALTKKGVRDRRLLLEVAGFLPARGIRNVPPPAKEGRTLISAPASPRSTPRKQ